MSPNLALIGCGAISQNFYLPALAKLRSQFGSIWLVDTSDHAVSQAGSVLSGRHAHEFAEVTDEIHLVIIATPNHLHFPLAYEALSRGADILIEKPFVIWPEEGRRLMKVAAESNRVIAINQTRRFLPLAGALRQQIREKAFGALKSIVHREGTKLVWPFESGAGFARGAQRTGVVMDFGVHVIDFYHYLLEPEWKLTSAIHDGFCGPEGLAEIQLLANDAPVTIRLSRYNTQENVAKLVFERAIVSFDVYDSTKYSIQWNTNKSTSIDLSDSGASDYRGIANQVLLNFLAASNKQEQAVCDAASSLPVIDLLDEIYRVASRYPVALGAV